MSGIDYPTEAEVAAELQAKLGDSQYDYIVVGLGYAGAVLLRRLAERAKLEFEQTGTVKKILAIDCGGPVQQATGGHADKNVTLEMDSETFTGVTEPDVPGNYNNVAFRAKFDGFAMVNEYACYQGCGFGGNGLYNGALYQEPASWWWDDQKRDGVHHDVFLTDEERKTPGMTVSKKMSPYFKKVREVLADAIHSRPSTDRVHYNRGLYTMLQGKLGDHKLIDVDYDTLGLPVDTFGDAPYKEYPTVADKIKDLGPELPNMSDLKTFGSDSDLIGFFAAPHVNAKGGIRAGPSQWLEEVLDVEGKVKTQYEQFVTVVPFVEAKKVIISDVGGVTTATGVITNVSYIRQTGFKYYAGKWDNFNTMVKTGGKVILCANSLPTCKLLYVSGVGPQDLKESVFPDTDAFQVNNTGVGVAVHEHITTSLGMKYTGSDYTQQPNTAHFNPGDFTSAVGKKNVDDYNNSKTGPFCQFGPVVASHFVANYEDAQNIQGGDYYDPTYNPNGEVTTELFYNPWGCGPFPSPDKPGINPYNGDGTFSIYVMLLHPQQRGLFRVSKQHDPSVFRPSYKDRHHSPDFKAEYVQIYMNNGPADWDPTPEQRALMQLPDYRELAMKDIGLMTASVKQVMEITGSVPNVECTLGPCVAPIESPNSWKTPDIHDVLNYVTYYDDYFLVNGERLPITHLQENHYNATAPLARNKTVNGDPLSAYNKGKYGVDPDTLEVRGVKGLCVADSSIFPKVIYCHPIGATMAVAEWAADILYPEPTVA